MARQAAGFETCIPAGPRGADAAVILEFAPIFAFEAAVGPEIMALKVVVPIYDLVAAATRVLVLEKARTGLLEFGLIWLVLRLNLRHCLQRFIFFLLLNRFFWWAGQLHRLNYTVSSFYFPIQLFNLLLCEGSTRDEVEIVKVHAALEAIAAPLAWPDETDEAKLHCSWYLI